MTSAKYYLNWLKETGRGHLIALVSWGGVVIYLCGMLFQLQTDTQYTFFGIGNGRELFYLCAGLGVLIGFWEFFYLFQTRRQEFYYSLPVRKSTIFGVRYLHGMCHGLLPIAAYMFTCGIYEGMQDADFLPYAGDYTIRSLAVYSMIFLLFYHIAVFAVLACGRVVSALALLGMTLFYFELLISMILTGIAEKCYQTFYRIPVLERLSTLLVPMKLGIALGNGESVFYEKYSIWESAPNQTDVIVAWAWILLLFGCCILMHREHRPENTGKWFAFSVTERTTEVLLAVLAGIGTAYFLTDLLEISWTENGYAALLVTAAGVIAAGAVHCLAEYLMQMSGRKIWRRKGQLTMAAGIVAAALLCVLLYRQTFDSFIPEIAETGSIGVSVAGIGMSHSDYKKILNGADQYLTEQQLEIFSLSGDALEAGILWIESLERADAAEGTGLTEVTVRYSMKDGTEKYRTYSVSETDLQAFSAVYNTWEYKEKAYPVPEYEDVSESRFTWENGIESVALKLSGEEKAALLDCYLKDIEALEMSDLKHYPIGMIEMKSEMRGGNSLLTVYVSFENTIRFLEEHHIDAEKRLADYPVQTIIVKETYPVRQNSLTSGGTTVHSYQEQEEIDTWKAKLIPQLFDIQPLLAPMDYSVDADAEVEEQETASYLSVECYGVYSGAK